MIWLHAVIYYHLTGTKFKMWLCHSLMTVSVRSPINRGQFYLPFYYYTFVQQIPLKSIKVYHHNDSSVNKQTPKMLTSEINKKTKFYSIMHV